MKHILLLLAWGMTLGGFAQTAHSHTVKLMGSNFGFTAVHDDDSLAWKAMLAGVDEVKRIEKLISSWDLASQTSEINRNAGIQPVKVDRELWNLVYRSIKISQLTDGAFDISFASMDKVWKFDGSMTTLPHPDAVRASVAHIDFRKISLDAENETIFLTEKGMKIGFGAIGKGYAANRAKSVMQAMGIPAGVVNAGGDLTAWGTQPDGTAWRVGIADPGQPGTVLAWLPVSEGAIVTSGDYERFATIDGKRYSHIIDPRSGYPVTGIKSVSVLAPDAEVADAFATAIFVMGAEQGLAFIDSIQGVECLIISDSDALITSKNLVLEYYEKGK